MVPEAITQSQFVGVSFRPPAHSLGGEREKLQRGITYLWATEIYHASEKASPNMMAVGSGQRELGSGLHAVVEHVLEPPLGSSVLVVARVGWAISG